MVRTETYYIVLKEPRKRGTGFRAASVLSAPDKLLNPLKILGKKNYVRAETSRSSQGVSRDNAVRGINEKHLSCKKKENDTYVRVYRIYVGRYIDNII